MNFPFVLKLLLLNASYTFQKLLTFLLMLKGKFEVKEKMLKIITIDLHTQKVKFCLSIFFFYTHMIFLVFMVNKQFLFTVFYYNF